jgi:putative ABC transport system substrate-binding protein
MTRREFITLLGGAAAAWPLAACAEQGGRVRRISAFTQALAGLGWTDGRNMRMDLRWAGPVVTSH